MADRQPTGTYIHGFSASEPARLVDQAAILAPAVFTGLDLGFANTLLEIGCGAGAQTRQILQRWPHLFIHAVDQNPGHLQFAASYLVREVAAGHVSLNRANAESLPFCDALFDAAITIWVLEHVRQPLQILLEMKRVLKPGGQIFLHEVDNNTFGFTPKNGIIRDWWQKYNAYQEKAGADPFIGQRLVSLVEYAGYSNIKTAPLYVVSSTREPERRLELLRYLRDLLLSGTENMKRAGYVNDRDAEKLKKEFNHLESTPDADFQYTAVRISACKL